MSGDGPQDYLKTLGKHMGVGLVVCVIPNTRLDRYVAVKRHVCMVMAVPSQVCSEAEGKHGKETKLGNIKGMEGKG